MKSQKVIALLLSMALSVSACMPLGNITALGAEAETAAEAVEVQEEVSDSEESMEPSEEEEVPSEAEAAGQAAVEDEDDSSDEQEAAVEETETAETEDTENVTSETGDEDNESADEADTAETAQDAEAPQTSEEPDSAAPEQAPAPAAETPAEDQADLTAPSEMDTVKTDAQNQTIISPDADFSDAIEINEGESKTVTIAEEDGYVLFSFVPEETGAYVFYSSDQEGDPYCYLYGTDHEQIDYSDDENGSNFRLKQSFTAGETYYFQACMFSDNTGTYTVHLEKTDYSFNRVGDYSRTVSPKEEVTLEVSAISSSEISYEWYSGTTGLIEGDTSATYTFTAESPDTYWCTVSDENGNSESIYFDIIIDNMLRAYPEGEDEESGGKTVYVAPNKTAELKAVVSAIDMTGLTYEWLDRDRNLIENANDSTFITGPITGAEEYYFRVYDQYGNSRDVYFYVHVENHLEAYTTDDNGEQTTYRELYVSPKESVDLNVSVSADDMSVLTYKWYKDGALIDGANSESLSTGSITGNTHYYFEVYDSYNNYQNIDFYIYVENHLEVHPLDTDGEWAGGNSISMGVSPNTPINLNVFASADDTTGLTYEWYKDYELVENENTAVFTIDQVTQPNDYFCRVSDSYGNSRDAYFYVYVENHLKANPKDDSYDEWAYIYAAPNQPLDLEVTVSAEDMSQLTYKWRNGDELVDNNSTTYTIPSVTGRMNYTFEVSDQYGNRQYVYFYIYVDNKLDAYPEGEDEYSSSTEIGVSPGTSTDLKVIVTAEDTSQITYTWYDKDWNTLEGEESAAFSTGPITREERYYCRVSDKYGNTDEVYFTVYAENNLMAYPKGDSPNSSSKSIYTLPNTAVDLIAIVSADDTSNLIYEWYDENDNLIDGVNAPSYRIDSVAKEGSYRLEVSDQYDNRRSINFYVYVDNNLTAQAVGNKRTFYVPVGTPVELGVIASADDTSQLTYDWYDNYEDIIETADSSSYKIDSVTESQSIHCSIGDQYGNRENVYFIIYVNSLTAYPEGEDNSRSSKTIDVVPGQSVDLKVNAAADDMSQITYKWYNKNGYIDTAKSSTYTIGSAMETTTYRCRVSDQYGNSKYVYFYINVKNNLKVYPEGEAEDCSDITVYVEEGKPAVLKAVVSADNMTGLTYEWRDQYDRILDNSGPVYTTDPITSSYHVWLNVTDLYGNTKNVNYDVYIQNHLTAYPKGEAENSDHSTIYVAYGESVDLEVIASADDMSQITYRWHDEQAEKARYGSSSFKTGPVRYENRYSCGVSDQYGNYRYIEFEVHVDNNLRAYPEGEAENCTSKDIYVEPGESVTLKVEVSAENKDDLVYSWREKAWDDYWEEYYFQRIGGAYSTTYTTKPLEEDSAYSFSVQDGYGNTSEVRFNVIVKNEKKQVISANEQLSLVYGNSGTIAVSGAQGALNFTSSNPAIASVDKAGTVKANKVGTTKITVFAEATDLHDRSNTVTVTVTVTAASIGNAVVNGIQNKTYNGRAQTQSPVVKVGSAILSESTDYTLTYRNNTNAGTATVTITGKGNCTGTVSKNFTIAKAAQSFRVSAASVLESGKTAKITASGAKETSKYNFASSNTRIATVAADGTVTGRNPGTVVITVSTAATANYKAASQTVRITVNKVLKKPGYCHFVKWNNKNYTGCRIAWNRVVGAEGYETHLCWTNGSHSSVTTVGPNVLYRDCKVYPNHVSCINVRAFYTLNGRKVYGPWSNMEFITPSPTRLTCTNVSKGGNLQMKVSWPIIYGSNGYNVFITTNPNGKWSWNQSTAVRANALSAVITKYQGGKLKKNTRYYVRIVTRRKFKNVFCSVPMPASNTYVGSFVIK